MTPAMLDRLILLRHGEAHGRSPTGDDMDRELTEAGRGAAAEAGRVLVRAGLTPDRALVSPAVRTRQTWAAARLAWPDPPPHNEEPGLYDETPAQLERIAEAAGTSCVLLVAHNPGLLALAEALSLKDRRLAAGFPPGSVAVLDRGPAAGEGEGWTLSLFHAPGSHASGPGR